jgi:hypothetical protein
MSDGQISFGAGVLIKVSPSEFIDRLTIMQVKTENLTDEGARRAVRDEWLQLQFVIKYKDKDYCDLLHENRLNFDWIEAVNVCLAANDTTSERFQQAVRGAFEANARRAAIKRRINEEAGWTGPQEQKTAAVMALAK